MTSNKVFKALADPTPRRVLELLREGAFTAGELADQFPVSKPTMSADFSLLQEAGLVEAEKDGRLGFADALGINTTTRSLRRSKRTRNALRKREA